MSDQPSQLELQVLALRQAVESLDARISGLETLVGEAAAPDEKPAGAGGDLAAKMVAAVEPRDTDQDARDTDQDEEPELTLAEMFEEAGANIGAGLIGGILLALAGAYLLRALTEAGVLARGLGITFGLVYALVWAVVCLLLGKRGKRGAASASGLAATLVALPMIWEATARLQVLSPWLAAVLLILVGALLLPIAELHRLAPVSAATVLGIGCVSLLLMFGIRRPEPFALTLAMLGVVAVLVGPRRGGPLPWFAYGFANLGALLLIAWSHGDRAIAFACPAITILVGLFISTSVLIIIQSRGKEQIGAHQIIQGTLVTLLGYGGALLIAAEHLPGVAKVLAAVGMTLGVAGYAFLLVTFHWSREHRWSFLLHSSLALALVAMGSWVVFPQPAVLFSALAVLLAAVGVRLDRVSPGLHAAMAVLLAAVVGDFGGMVFHLLAAPGDSVWPTITPESIITLVAAVLCTFLPHKAQSPVWPDALPRLGRGVVILVTMLGLDALLVWWTAPFIAGEPGAFEPGILAALRTGVLATSVVVLAALSRYPRLLPAQRLVWPLLLIIPIKLAAEDFPRGRAITMAVALLLYGVALILSTRLLRVAKATRPAV